jgi:hypothetical protein
VAPLLSLAPLLSCYCFALSAALQQPQEHQRRVLHGVKSLKAVCTIFKRLSTWHGELRHRGPWNYDWAPPMAQLVRDWSASFIIAVCLDEPERIPEDEDVHKALAHAEQKQAADPARWRKLQVELADAHAQLDAALSRVHIQALAAVLARMVLFMTLPTKQPQAELGCSL